MKKSELATRVIMAAREYGISTTLFRNAIGDKIGVNVTDMECLALLFFKGISTPTELSRYTGLSSGSTTAMLDRLEKARLIQRQPNPKDKRGTLITVNKSSVQTVGPYFAGMRDAQDKLLKDFSSQDLQIIAEFLEKYTLLWEEVRTNLLDK